MTRLSEIKAKQTAEVNRKRHSIFCLAMMTGAVDAIWLTGIDLAFTHTHTRNHKHSVIIFTLIKFQSEEIFDNLKDE